MEKVFAEIEAWVYAATYVCLVVGTPVAFLLWVFGVIA